MNWLLATRHVIDIKLPILNALKWCQQCTATHSIRTFKTQVGRQQCRGLGWSYSKTVHLRQMSMSSKPRRLLVAQFCTSRQTFETDEDKKKLADCFKDDPETREFLKEISRDFNIDHNRGNYIKFLDIPVNLESLVIKIYEVLSLAERPFLSVIPYNRYCIVFH